MELDGYHVGTSHRTESRFTVVDFISLRFLLNIFNTFPMEKGDRSGFTGECSGKIFNFCNRTVRRIHLEVGNSYHSSGVRSFFPPQRLTVYLLKKLPKKLSPIDSWKRVSVVFVCFRREWLCPLLFRYVRFSSAFDYHRVRTIIKSSCKRNEPWMFSALVTKPFPCTRSSENYSRGCAPSSTKQSERLTLWERNFRAILFFY